MNAFFRFLKDLVFSPFRDLRDWIKDIFSQLYELRRQLQKPTQVFKFFLWVFAVVLALSFREPYFLSMASVMFGFLILSYIWYRWERGDWRSDPKEKEVEKELIDKEREKVMGK